MVVTNIRPTDPEHSDERNDTAGRRRPDTSRWVSRGSRQSDAWRGLGRPPFYSSEFDTGYLGGDGRYHGFLLHEAFARPGQFAAYANVSLGDQGPREMVFLPPGSHNQTNLTCAPPTTGKGKALTLPSGRAFCISASPA